MMEERRKTRRTEALLRRWDRVFRWSFVLSILVHVAIVLFFREELILPEIPTAAAGERAGDPHAAAGGGTELIAFRLETPPPVPEPTPTPPEPVPVPVPVPEEPQPEVEPQKDPPSEPAQSQSQNQQNAAGTGRGTETGPGTETGTGRGDGGAGEEGLNRLTAPSPRGMILPPSDRPGSVKGKTITVYVFVAASGAVVSDSTRIAPSTGDSRFDRRLRDDAAQWKFRPGMRGGTPIASWFPYTITF